MESFTRLVETARLMAQQDAILASRVNDPCSWEMPPDFEVWERPDESADAESKSLRAVERES